MINTIGFTILLFISLSNRSWCQAVVNLLTTHHLISFNTTIYIYLTTMLGFIKMITPYAVASFKHNCMIIQEVNHLRFPLRELHKSTAIHRFTNSIIILFLGLGSINFFNIFSSMACDLMTPDIWDYQQYVSGERLESSSGIFGILFNPLNRVLCLIVPAVYAMIGFTSEWNILYFDDTRNQVFLWTIILMVAAKVLSAIPYFFYDLSEAKHAKIIEELKAQGAEVIFLEVEHTNEPAIAVYTKCGFEEYNRRRDYYGAGRDAILMKRAVAEV